MDTDADKYLSLIQGDIRAQELEGHFKNKVKSSQDASELEDLEPESQRVSFLSLAEDEAEEEAEAESGNPLEQDPSQTSASETEATTDVTPATDADAEAPPDTTPAEDDIHLPSAGVTSTEEATTPGEGS